jgi:hypothetical protein
VTYSKKFIDKHRDFNVDIVDWPFWIEDELKRDMKDIGVTVHKICYSISYSQGDGAGFTGTVDDWELFLRHYGIDNPMIIQNAQETWSYSWYFPGTRCHYMSVIFDGDIDLSPMNNPYYEDTDPLQYAVWKAVMSTVDALELEVGFKGVLQEVMRKLYSDLLKEYEYLTSDEQVLAALVEHGIVEPLTELEN